MPQIGFRDSYGIRPLVLGSRPSASGEGMDYMMASESVALRQLGYKRSDIRDILPGEAVIIPKGKLPVSARVQAQKRYAPDIFEVSLPPNLAIMTDFHRSIATLPGQMPSLMVFLCTRAGRICSFSWDPTQMETDFPGRGYKLGDRVTKVLTPEQLKEIDVVMPIPETSNTSAPCCAERLSKPYCQGFVKNRYVFRSTYLSESLLHLLCGVWRPTQSLFTDSFPKTCLNIPLII